MIPRMAARCTTPAAAMHHFGGMGAPWCRCRTSGGGVCFARSGCRITNGQGAVLARRTQLHEMLWAWREQAAKLEAGEISQEEYDRWRYHYPEYDSNQIRAKVPPEGLI